MTVCLVKYQSLERRQFYNATFYTLIIFFIVWNSQKWIKIVLNILKLLAKNNIAKSVLECIIKLKFGQLNAIPIKDAPKTKENILPMSYKVRNRYRIN